MAHITLVLLSLATGASAQTGAPAPDLKSLFDAAWAHQPESHALQSRRDAVQAQRRAASAWTAERPALEASYKTDRPTGNEGARDLTVGVTVPLWLPGERRGAGALAEAEAAAVDSRFSAARLRMAGAVREAWWSWQRAKADVEITREQLESTRRIAGDVARRARAGELARSDQYQADGAVAGAEIAMAQSEVAAAVALQQLQSLIGGPFGSGPAAGAAPEPVPVTENMPTHPALSEQADRAAVAERSSALAATQSRANPELTLSTTRDRGAFGQGYGQAVTLAVRIPMGGGPRHDGRVASARAEAAEALAQLSIEHTRLQSERNAAKTRVEATRLQVIAAERRATLARETRGFFDKSYRLGETDLPTRLRVEAEAADAERQAARSRVEQAAAISAWRQALGLLPQ